MEKLYAPVANKDIRRIYPELGSMPEFKGLLVREMNMVWYYACPSSEIRLVENKDDRWRIEQAIEKAYGKEIDKEMKDRLLQLSFTEKQKVAIDRMKRFDPDVRSRAKQMIFKMFDNFENMVTVNEDEFISRGKDGEPIGTDFEAKNKYINFCAKISETIPSLIKQMEEGFGIVEESGKEAATSKAIDRFHSSNK